MSEATDPVAAAAARLEAAVQRLSRAAVARPVPPLPAEAQAPDGASPPGIDPAAVAALAERLDTTIARLRGVLGEEG